MCEGCWKVNWGLGSHLVGPRDETRDGRLSLTGVLLSCLLFREQSCKMPSLSRPCKKGGRSPEIFEPQNDRCRKRRCSHLTDLEIMFIALEDCFVLIRVPKADKLKMHTY